MARFIRSEIAAYNSVQTVCEKTSDGSGAVTYINLHYEQAFDPDVHGWKCVVHDVLRPPKKFLWSVSPGYDWLRVTSLLSGLLWFWAQGWKFSACSPSPLCSASSGCSRPQALGRYRRPPYCSLSCRGVLLTSSPLDELRLDHSAGRSQACLLGDTTGISKASDGCRRLSCMPRHFLSLFSESGT